MPTENRSSTVSHFQREDRYIVIKRSDLDRLAGLDRHLFSQASRRAHEQMFAAGAPARSFLVIESDWPEFEPTWAAIEARMAGNPVGQRQRKPVHMMRSHGSCCWEESSGESLDIALSMPEEYEVRTLYTHPAPADAGEVERLRLEIEQLRFSLEAHDHESVQDDCARAENRTLSDEVERLRESLACALKSAENVNAEAVALRIQLSEHQWHYEPYDDHYHRDAGHYCPSCGGEQDSGHKSGCDIAKALSASAGQEKEA